MGSHGTKSDLSPVTEADLWAGRFISRSLQRLTPSLPVISEEEEFGEIPSEFWLVDPLDGTKEFIKGFDDFTVNIARIRDGRAVFGIVSLPAKGTSYIGGRDYGTRVFIEGAERELRVGGSDKSPRIAVSRSHLDSDTEQFCSQFQDHVRISAGSSLKFCLIAEGLADYYPRFGRTMEWDTAAGQAVLEGAGGSVLERQTLKELGYGKKSLENPSFIAVSSKRLPLPLENFN